MTVLGRILHGLRAEPQGRHRRGFVPAAAEAAPAVTVPAPVILPDGVLPVRQDMFAGSNVLVPD